MEQTSKSGDASGNEILENAGTISHKQAIEKAQVEYNKYKQAVLNETSTAEEHFIEHIESSAKKIENKKLKK